MWRCDHCAQILYLDHIHTSVVTQPVAGGPKPVVFDVFPKPRRAKG
jgi:hypothetical protein